MLERVQGRAKRGAVLERVQGRAKKLREGRC